MIIEAERRSVRPTILDFPSGLQNKGTPVMVRLRFKMLAGAGLALACGCDSLCHFSLLRHRETCTPECCSGVVADQEGPVLDAGSVPVAPGNLPPGYAPRTLPPTAVPQLNPPPRLVPQPQQSPTMPYTPSTP